MNDIEYRELQNFCREKLQQNNQSSMNKKEAYNEGILCVMSKLHEIFNRESSEWVLATDTSCRQYWKCTNCGKKTSAKSNETGNSGSLVLPPPYCQHCGFKNKLRRSGG